MSNEYLTIIVPVYNVESYLGECIDSLLHQTMIAHKVILVDDGSKDKSGEIAKAYAARYPEMIQYVYQENHGLGSARNQGLKRVDTPYVTFLDSDDWMQPRTVENVFAALQKEREEPDIAFMTPVVYDATTGLYQPWADTSRLEQLFSMNRVLAPKDKPEMYALEASVCRCVFNTGFLRKVNFSFPEGTLWEDVFPHFYLFHWARRCISVCDAGFCYRINTANQITLRIDKRRLDIVKVYSGTLKYALENDWSDQEIAYILNMMQLFVDWSVSVSTISVRKELVYALHELYKCIPKSYYKAYLNVCTPSRHERLIWKLVQSPILHHIYANYFLMEEAKRAFRKLKKLMRR